MRGFSFLAFGFVELKSFNARVQSRLFDDKISNTLSAAYVIVESYRRFYSTLLTAHPKSTIK